MDVSRIEITSSDDGWIIVDVSQVMSFCRDESLLVHASLDKEHWWDANASFGRNPVDSTMSELGIIFPAKYVRVRKK